MIVVFDTNVIISSLLSSRSAPSEIIRRWQTGEFGVAPSGQEFVRAKSFCMGSLKINLAVAEIKLSQS
jgi:predicted nucleic acid-binding protein